MSSIEGTVCNGTNQDTLNSVTDFIDNDLSTQPDYNSLFNGSTSILEDFSSGQSAFPALLCSDTERLISTSGNVERLLQGINLETGKGRAMELTDYERNKMADMYEMVRSDTDRGSIEEMLLSNKSLLDREINILVFHDCPCLNMFEKPFKTQSVSDYSLWIRRGRCQCEGIHDQSVSVRLLHVAASLGNMWLTNVLLDQGCNVCALTHFFHHSALHLSVYNSEMEVMNTLVERACETLKTMNNSGLLQVLITEKPDNHLSMLKLLIDSGICNVNERDELNQRSLATAIELNDIDSVELLLSKGADPNLPNGCGNPMLNKALYAGNMSCVKSLLAAGANVNASCKDLGYPSLICAFSCQFLGHGPKVPHVMQFIDFCQVWQRMGRSTIVDSI